MPNEVRALEAATRSEAAVRIPRLWPIVVILALPVLIGLGVFLKRYRGTDRTAMALGVLVGGGLCLIVGLAWFQRRFGGKGRHQAVAVPAGKSEVVLRYRAPNAALGLALTLLSAVVAAVLWCRPRAITEPSPQPKRSG